MKSVNQWAYEIYRDAHLQVAFRETVEKIQRDAVEATAKVKSFCETDYDKGVRDGLERAAKALCDDCSMERPVYQDEDRCWMHDYDNVHYSCRAWAIQALIKASGEGEKI